MPRPPGKVLLIAEACNPEWVSIPLEGWSHSQAISKLTPAHLVTQIRNRDAILRAGLIEGKDFTAIDSEPAARPAYALASLLRGGKGKGWTTTTALAAAAYPYFERLVWQQFGPRIAAGEFDIVHRLTPLSPTIPSSIAAKCREAGVPFVLGPLNGGVPWPPGFDSSRRREKEWLSYIRDAHRFIPGYLQTRRCAAAILIGSRDTWRQMPRSFHSKCFYVPENAIDPARFTTPRDRTPQRPLRAIFVGRLVPYKGADMLLEAATPLLKSGASPSRSSATARKRSFSPKPSSASRWPNPSASSASSRTTNSKITSPRPTSSPSRRSENSAALPCSKRWPWARFPSSSITAAPANSPRPKPAISSPSDRADILSNTCAGCYRTS